ncbi:helix-turn-helix domain-containing protein [Pseudobutyrivibrio sp.]|uniref:helix-turn-helix domain-containing protein n=1 Tax=Pseudobutyrivibrio sp. TaxID=2014367 RepID=UPI0025E5BC15|nr:helix-turn-helix domain-containing protein [Pseudobutyrivibrio sp.]
MLINEAVESGASLSKACERLGITEQTYYRWVKLDKTFDSYEDRRTFADHSNPVNKITPAERQEILDTVNSEEFSSMSPCQILPILADKGTYIASERTFYRVLNREKMQNHRGISQESYKHAKPTPYCATAPNQV